MARGAKKVVEAATSGGMPKFVDVKLTQEQKKAFLETPVSPVGLVVFLQDMCDNGYRVGCSWSGEHQTYTVSLTCRDEQSPNNGLCMTSFAGQLDRAVALARFKHDVVTEGKWLASGNSFDEDFG